MSGSQAAQGPGLSLPASALPNPPQARGRRSRDRVIAAAWKLLDEHGAHSGEVTVRAIAAAANVSTGSIYHHFGDLDQIIAAVAERYVAEMSATVAAARDVASRQSWEEMVDAALAGYVDFFRRHAGLRDLWFDEYGSSGVVELHRAHRERIAQELRRNFTDLTSVDLGPVVHRVAIAIAGSLFELAFRADPAGDAQVITELHRTLRGFYRERLEACAQ
ncbi:TetR/AcrR family transcriptional regulator [Streptomyces chartreusis]|uniref:TetR/AcrR family transcriptional regulator n=1 Tax=Streptomyces chartreusis TaxID=1969 RepID=UPI00371D6F75